MISRGIRAFQRVGYDRRLIEDERIYINALRRIARPRDIPCRSKAANPIACGLLEAVHDGES